MGKLFRLKIQLGHLLRPKDGIRVPRIPSKFPSRKSKRTAVPLIPARALISSRDRERAAPRRSEAHQRSGGKRRGKKREFSKVTGKIGVREIVAAARVYQRHARVFPAREPRTRTQVSRSSFCKSDSAAADTAGMGPFPAS